MPHGVVGIHTTPCTVGHANGAMSSVPQLSVRNQTPRCRFDVRRIRHNHTYQLGSKRSNHGGDRVQCTHFSRVQTTTEKPFQDNERNRRHDKHRSIKSTIEIMLTILKIIMLKTSAPHIGLQNQQRQYRISYFISQKKLCHVGSQATINKISFLERLRVCLRASTQTV